MADGGEKIILEVEYILCWIRSARLIIGKLYIPTRNAMLKNAVARGGNNNTVFSKNVSLLLLNGDSKYQILVGMYYKLSGVVQTINALLKEYSKGNFYAVANILTKQAYNKLSINLASMAAEANKFPEYEIIRGSATSSLAGLYQCVLQYSELVDVRAQLELCREQEEILHDPKKLSEYIEKLNQRRLIFPDSHVQVIPATLKPQYAAYVKQYGFPEGAVFDPDKLAFILQQLNMA
ncbi:hypothetical protein EB093_07935 [bacterium]|nr:hypothetical protein [bacterium]